MQGYTEDPSHPKSPQQGQPILWTLRQEKQNLVLKRPHNMNKEASEVACE